MSWNLKLFLASFAALFGLFLFFCCSGFVSAMRRWISPDVSLLLVVRNQAAVIEGIMRDIMAHHQRPLCSFELVVVDDCSDDETPEILVRLHRRLCFVLIQMQQFPGEKPQEVGLRFCQGEAVYCMELREETDPRILLRLVGSLLRGEKPPLSEAERCLKLVVFPAGVPAGRGQRSHRR